MSGCFESVLENCNLSWTCSLLKMVALEWAVLSMHQIVPPFFLILYYYHLHTVSTELRCV